MVCIGNAGHDVNVGGDGILFIGGHIAAHFQIGIVASPCKKAARIGGIPVGVGGGAVMAASGQAEIGGQKRLKRRKKFACRLKAQIDPRMPRRVFPVTPKVAVVCGGQFHARACTQGGATMGTSAGIVMHKVYGVVGRKPVNARISDQGL